MTLSTSSSAYSLPSGGYNLRANTAAAQNAPPLGSGNYPNPIEKRIKLSHSHPERSLISKAKDVLESDSLFFKLCEMERQIDEKILKKQNEMAASSFRANKLRRAMKIYVSNSFSESEGASNGGSMMSISPSNSMENVNDVSVAANPNTTSSNSGCWILRIEGKVDQSGLSAAGSTSQSNSASNLSALKQAAAAAAAGQKNGPKKFSSYLKSLIVEFEDECVEWNKYATESSVSVSNCCDGFEIKRPLKENEVISGGEGVPAVIPCKIHLQFDFSPERFRLAPGLAQILNLTVATKPAIIVALWQYIKLHKLQESDEKKIINNDGALQELFRVPRMSFSDIPVLIEPYLLPVEPVTIAYEIKSRQDLNVLDQVFEVEVDVEDPKSAFRSFLPATLFRDLNFYEGRLKELVEALHAAQNNQRLLSAFSAAPIDTAQKILKTCSQDFETLIGDLPCPLDELKSAEFFDNENVSEAVNDFLALNPRFLPNNI